MTRYDYIICGFGCAGMSLVYQLLQSPLKNARIALVDESNKQDNDRTWCYWAKEPVAAHPKNTELVSWNSVQVQVGEKKIVKALDGLHYYHIKSSDFYKEILTLVEQHPNVTFIQSKVEFINTLADKSTAVTLANGDTLSASKTFNSIPLGQQLEPNTLKQVFLGWKIQTDASFFDPSVPTLMHFPDGSFTENEFFYILPFNETTALVEYTLYTTQALDMEALKGKLEEYLRDILPCTYKIIFEEHGAIPMTTKIQGKSTSSNIIEIGSIAGCIKPSTGYTFYDIQKHSEELVTQLLQEDTVYKGWIRKTRFQFYDNILLNIAKKWPEKLPSIFAQMFAKNQGAQVLRFLHEETSLWEDLQILAKFKYGIFIKSLLNYEKN
ncbi:lycopene cyclase family protein [Mongoliitalea daihaiensis]|uniref:lycopene cyclase family protein n=1 Tax=Mongoliitalea daihaiensis TaxID=2782006 RepID=UPI001F3F1130|nr:lycopene cyclase family protein [Mongoliitalea daihaiensis]UJP64125.1 Lycopene beta cyclase [Mongoliitalea daihaiensis]